jgi:NAD(P)-dependent dehydrogenase (short-subunit alcohol dehydrogenase family)
VPAPPPESSLDGRIALVTGAAGTIGGATVHALAAAGARVVATDIAPTRLDAAAASVRSVHGDVVATHVADLADPDSAAAIVAAAISVYGRLDVVVHAAIDHPLGAVDELTPEQFHRAFAVNVGAAMWVVRAALPHLRAGSGSVVLFSSIQAGVGMPRFSLYASTKGAIETLTHHLAVELGPRGVRVNAIAPGRVQRDDELASGAAGELRSYPLGRFGTGNDIARAVVFLASDASSWVTGSVVAVDGGAGSIHPSFAGHEAHRANRARTLRSVLRRYGGRIRR